MNVSRRKVKLLLVEIKGFHRHLALASLVSSYDAMDLFSQVVMVSPQTESPPH